MTTIKVKILSAFSIPKNFTGTVIYVAGFWSGSNGSYEIEWFREYLVNGVLHREDGPARIYNDEWKSEQYWLNGELQRIVRNGSTWWENGKRIYQP